MCRTLISMAVLACLSGLAFLGGCSTAGPGGQQNVGVYAHSDESATTAYQQQQKEWDRTHNANESQMEEDE